MTGNSTQVCAHGFPSPANEITVSQSSQSQLKLNDKGKSTEMCVSQILKCKGQTIKDVTTSFCFTDF